MTVAINARAAIRAELGGVERHARELAQRLPALAPERYRVVRPPSALAHRAGHAWEQAWLPFAAHGCELILSPANLAPLAAGGRNVVVIHDVAALRHPDWYGRSYAAWQRALLPRLARGARLVLTVSRFSKEEIVAALGAPPESVEVVPGGVSERFRPDDAGGTAAAAARYALGLGERPYVLTVATRIARKNLAALDSTRTALAERGIELVAAGSGRGYMRAGAADPVRALGYVPEEHLPGLYAGARAFVLPSLYEGFGLTCLEAMACGTPVVAANRGALPDTCGDAALLVDPEHREELAHAVLLAATDERERARLTAAGVDRARRFGWDRTARETDAALARLLSEPSA
jgi:glycosyltransferase involved in cell wall biosynthesis